MKYQRHQVSNEKKGEVPCLTFDTGYSWEEGDGRALTSPTSGEKERHLTENNEACTSRKKTQILQYRRLLGGFGEERVEKQKP